MVEKATASDIAAFQAYTIRSLDNKVSSESDIKQYKLLSIKEDALDNRENYLDVMCFPVLFPIGQFGEHHPRQVKSVTPSMSNQGYSTKMHVSEKTLSMSFSFSGKRKCVRSHQVCTTC